jgi:hypothetical protein
MLVDFEAAWLDLKAEVDGKQGIGVDRLLALMARLETQHRVPESVAEEALRLYGLQFTQDLRALARGESMRASPSSPDAGAGPPPGMAPLAHPTIREDLDDCRARPEARAGSRG